MPSLRRRWFGTTAFRGGAVLAALVLAAGLTPARASDPTAPAKGGDPPSLFQEDPDVVPPLRADLLDHVSDSAGLPVLPEKPPDPKDRAKERAYLLLLDEYEAYCDALVKAAHTPDRVFATHVRPDVTYAHLFNEPRKYRGQVVRFEGQLHRVRRYDPPLAAAQAGVHDLYEGWMFSKLYGLNPVCLIFTDLPPGVEVAEQTHVQVAFDGYFFKKYRYHAADSKPGTAREVPLVIGNAPVLREAAAGAPASSAWSGSLLAVLLVLVMGTVALAAGLHWWFRHADRAVRRRLAGARELAPPPDLHDEVRLPARWPPDPSAS